GGQWQEAVKLACAAGIDGLELYNYYDVPALTYRKLMNEAGVVCCGTHNHCAQLRDDLDHVKEYNYVRGSRTIIWRYHTRDERGRGGVLRHPQSLGAAAGRPGPRHGVQLRAGEQDHHLPLPDGGGAGQRGELPAGGREPERDWGEAEEKRF